MSKGFSCGAVAFGRMGCSLGTHCSLASTRVEGVSSLPVGVLLDCKIRCWTATSNVAVSKLTGWVGEAVALATGVIAGPGTAADAAMAGTAARFVWGICNGLGCGGGSSEELLA